MIIYDLIHGYQPFQPPNFIPSWVEKNLQETYFPVSASSKSGLIPRGIQLQGWTIQSWLESPEPIKSLAKKTIDNLQLAHKKEYIEIGVSGYSHPMFPLLSPDLIYTQIKLDLELSEKYIGKPTWFWPPEGAVDKKTLKVLFKRFPEFITVITDKSLGKTNFSGFIKIKHKNGTEQKILVCNTLLKDIVSNATRCYPNKPAYVPKNVNWPDARRAIYDNNCFKSLLGYLGGNQHVLARDWDFYGWSGALQKTGSGMDIKGLVELEAQFKLPSEVNWSKAEIVDIEEIKPGSWEVDMPEDDPFLYWWPNEKTSRWQNLNEDTRSWILRWKNLVNDYNEIFEKKVKAAKGVDELLKDETVKEKLRKSLPALMSCTPWHFLAKPEWGPDPGLSKSFWETIILPAMQQLQSIVV